MITISVLTKEDIDKAAELEKENFTHPWKAEDFKEAIGNPKRIYMIAKENELVIGNCGLFLLFEEGEISNVSVKTEYRKQGIAYDMLIKLLETAKEQGAKSYTLEVRKSNYAAIQLYEKLGFITEGVRKNFYENPIEDALIMWKR